MNQIQDSQTAQRFLAIAQQDLKAARCLYDHEYYPQAVFYLEQSVEKGLKSYSITLRIIDEDEARRDISHKTLKIYEKTTNNFIHRIIKVQENLKIFPSLEAFCNQHQDFSDDIRQQDDTLNLIRSLSKQRERSLRLSKEELNKFIKILNDLNREAKREYLKAKTRPVSPSEFRASKKFSINMLEAALTNQPERLKQEKEKLNGKLTFAFYEKLMKDNYAQSIPPMEIFLSFFHLSVILQPHAIARYPKSDFYPVDFYTQDLPLVKSFLKLADITERVLNQLDEFYQKAEVQHDASI